MILHAEQGERLVAEPLERVVVQVNVGQLNIVGVDGIRVHGEIVIVRGDFNFAGGIVANGVITAMMTELELVGLAAESETAKLVPEEAAA